MDNMLSRRQVLQAGVTAVFAGVAGKIMAATAPAEAGQSEIRTDVKAFMAVPEQRTKLEKAVRELTGDAEAKLVYEEKGDQSLLYAVSSGKGSLFAKDVKICIEYGTVNRWKTFTDNFLNKAPKDMTPGQAMGFAANQAENWFMLYTNEKAEGKVKYKFTVDEKTERVTGIEKYKGEMLVAARRRPAGLVA